MEVDTLVCEVCGKGPRPKDGGVSIFRTGPKGPGQNPHSRCQEHLTKGTVKTIEALSEASGVDVTVIELVNLIESSDKPLQ